MNIRLRWSWSLFMGLLCFAIAADDVKQMSMLDKDKHLACSELVSIKTDRDRKKIDNILQQDTYLKNGIIQMMSLDMMIKCVNNIDDELVRLMYVDMERVVQMEGVREERIAFLNVNYNDYKDLNQFVYEQHHRDMLKISLALRDDMKELLKRKKEKKEKMKEQQQQQGNKDNDNDKSKSAHENTEL